MHRLIKISMGCSYIKHGFEKKIKQLCVTLSPKNFCLVGLFGLIFDRKGIKFSGRTLLGRICSDREGRYPNIWLLRGISLIHPVWKPCPSLTSNKSPISSKSKCIVENCLSSWYFPKMYLLLLTLFTKFVCLN